MKISKIELHCMGKMKKRFFKNYNRFTNFRNIILTTILGIFICWVVGNNFLNLPAFSQETVTLNVLMTATEVQPWKDVLIPAFEAENPGIRINMIEGPNATDLNEDLYTSAFILGDSPYDLINMDVIWTPKFAAAGWLLPLDDRITETQLKAFLNKDVEGGRYNGKLYRVPFRSDAGMLYYRTDLLKKAGYNPPETFEELVKISQELQEKTEVNWGYLWQGGQYEGLSAMFVEILEGFGGYWVNPKTKEVGLDQPAAIKAVDFLQNTIKIGISPPGVTTYKEEETRRIFQNGESIFLRSWPYVWPLANQKTSAVNGKIGIKPMVHSPNSPSGACLGGWGLGISKSSKHPDAAWKAIQFFTSEEAQRKFILETGFVPSRRYLFTDPKIVAEYSHYPELLQVVEKAVLRPPIAQYAQTSDILQRYLSAAISGRMSPEKAMKAAANETRRLLETS